MKNITKKQWIIILVVVAILVWYFFIFKKKKTTSSYAGVYGSFGNESGFTVIPKGMPPVRTGTGPTMPGLVSGTATASPRGGSVAATYTCGKNAQGDPCTGPYYSNTGAAFCKCPGALRPSDRTIDATKS